MSSLEQTVLELQSRVQALETRVAALTDTRQIEERITERVSAQVPRVNVGSVVEALAGKPLPPAVKDLVGVATQPSTLKQVAQSSWLALDMFQELVTVARMLLDRHYHMAWITRFLVILFGIGIIASGLWFPLAGSNWVGNLPNKLFDLLLAGIVFLALFCETRRYKDWRVQNAFLGQPGSLP